MDQGNVPSGSPIPEPCSSPREDWASQRIAAVIVAGGLAPLGAYDWAQPREAGSLRLRLEGPIFDLVPLWVACLVIFVWRRRLWSGLLVMLAVCLLPMLVVLAPLVWAEAMGWPGGWALGVAGLVAGAAFGWLFMWLLWLSGQLNARQGEAEKADSRTGLVPFPPLSPWAFRGYLAVLVASAIAILLGWWFCPVSSWQSLLVFSLGASALGTSLDSLWRPWASRIRETKRFKD